MSFKKPRLVILNNNYPSKENLYGDVFVHSRLKYYLNDFEVVVIGYRPLEKSKKYNYEGIDVMNFSDKPSFVKCITEQNPDLMGIHFVSGWYFDSFLKHLKIPVFIWVHGEEALGWYRRLYYFKWKTAHKFAIFALKNWVQLYYVRRIIRFSNKFGNIRFIFVSNWMKRITETDTLTRIKHFSIIPNPIDSNLFQYHLKTPEQALRVLLIRSFETHKYANDKAVAAINLLRSRPIFKKMTFHLYGKGKFFDKITASVKNDDNVILHNYFIENHQIPSVHKDFGIFLCPTRQDAQGVSMCEAMSSGLVPVTSDNTAIPEFCEHGVSGFLTRNALELANAIEQLASDPVLFARLSRQAADSIQSKAGHNVVIATELKLLKEGYQQT